MIDVHLDPLREVRTAKRWAMFGTGAAAALLLPAYVLLLGLGPWEVLFILAPAVLAVVAGIELVTRWEYRMRRRYAYPHRLGYEMGAIHDFVQAGARAAQLILEWLGARAVVVAWLSEDGRELKAVASAGLAQGWTEAAPVISLGRRPQKETLLAGGRAGAEPSIAGTWFSGHKPETLNLIPLLSRDRPQGVLVIAAPRTNQAGADQRLLAALGMVLGLALDNSRLYEGQRAHAHHLRELNRMKSDFLSTVSHELRTPLTSIMMAAEMLLEEEETRDPDSTRGRLVRNIVKGASRLSTLVSDLVNISRNDDFRPRLELDPVPVSDVLGNAVSIIQPLIAAKHQTMEINVNVADAVVMVDRLRFDQVLINLLSNAQRYSPPGGHIQLTTESREDEVVFSVTDSGPGVSGEDAELIFEPFYRGDRSGLGLGLAIAKSLVELHQGRIWVESANGRGSSFCVALPAHGIARTRRRTAPGVAVAR